MLDWKVVTLACVVFVVVGVLDYADKIPGEVVAGLASGLLGWLVPSPVQRKEVQP